MYTENAPTATPLPQIPIAQKLPVRFADVPPIIEPGESCTEKYSLCYSPTQMPISQKLSVTFADNPSIVDREGTEWDERRKTLPLGNPRRS